MKYWDYRELDPKEARKVGWRCEACGRDIGTGRHYCEYCYDMFRSLFPTEEE